MNYFQTYVLSVVNQNKEMKITEKQLHMLVRVLEGSLLVCDRKDVNIFGSNYAARLLLHNDIRNQQSDELIDVRNETNQI